MLKKQICCFKYFGRVISDRLLLKKQICCFKLRSFFKICWNNGFLLKVKWSPKKMNLKKWYIESYWTIQIKKEWY